MNDYKKRFIICLDEIYTNIFFYLSPLPFRANWNTNIITQLSFTKFHFSSYTLPRMKLQKKLINSYFN